jgi:hypothetical protein
MGGDVSLDCGLRAVEIDCRYLITAPQMLGQRLKGRPRVHRQPERCLMSRLGERTLVAGDRQQNEEDALGIADQPLDGHRAAGVGLELRGLDEALNVRHLLRDEAALRVHLARTETSRLRAFERQSS